MNERQTFTEEMRRTALRDEVSRLNAEALASLMSQHSLFIPAKDFPNWRPTALVSGDIPGVTLGVTIIATNGILAYFVFDDATVPVLCGHTQCFTGDIRPLHSVQDGRVPKTRIGKPRRTKDEKMLDMLEELKRRLQSK